MQATICNELGAVVVNPVTGEPTDQTIEFGMVGELGSVLYGDEIGTKFDGEVYVEFTPDGSEEPLMVNKGDVFISAE